MIIKSEITDSDIPMSLLQDSDEIYHTLFESMCEGFELCEMIWDDRGQPIDFIILNANPAHENITGLRREQIMGRRATEIFSTIDPLALKRYAEAIRTGKQVHFEEYQEMLQRWLRIEVHHHKGNQFVILLHNVTKRKEMEKELDRQRNFLQAVFSVTPELVLTVDRNMICHFLSPSVEKLLGIKAEDLIGKHWRNMGLPPVLMEPYEAMAMEVFKTGKPVYGHTQFPVGGDLRIFEDYLSPVFDASGEVLYVLTLTRDISDLRRSEMSAKEAKARAELYLDLMSHDISNMHQVALVYIDMARDMPQGPRQQELLDKSIKVLKRSADLIKNVNSLQKIQDVTLKNREIDVCLLLSDVYKEYGSVPAKNITLNFNGNDKCVVQANELLYDVFSNLVGNAIKHTNDNCAIAISLETSNDGKGKSCRICFEDSGPGIPDDLKEKLFASKLNGSPGSNGNGLGLYLVKLLVDSYSGQVCVEDLVQGDHTKGTRFIVMLPALDINT